MNRVLWWFKEVFCENLYVPTVIWVNEWHVF